MKKKSPICSAPLGWRTLGAALLFAALPVNGALLLYEPFDYPVGALLDGQTPPPGQGMIGSWTAWDHKAFGIKMADGPRPVPTWRTWDGAASNIVQNGKFISLGADGRAHIRGRITLAPAVTNTFVSGAVTWMSMVSAQADVPWGFWPMLAVGAGDLIEDRGNKASDQAIGGGGYFGNGATGPVGAHYWDDEDANGTFEIHASLANAGVNLAQIIIFKITWDDPVEAGFDKVQAFQFDVGTGAVMPTEAAFDIGAVTNTADLDQSRFTTLSYGGGRVELDEVRIGTTFADVIGTVNSLVLTKSVSAVQAATGSSLTYTIDVLNASTSVIGGIVVTDALPAEVSFVSSVPPADLTNGNDHVFHLGALAPGSNLVITLDAQVIGLVETTFVNLATVAMTNENLSLTSTRATAETTIPPRDLLRLTKFVSSTNMLSVTSLVYTIVASNMSLETAGGVVVTDSLPVELIFISSSPPPTASNGNEFVYSIGALAPGANLAITVAVSVAISGTGTIQNIATIATTNQESTVVNNQSIAVTLLPDTDLDGLNNVVDPDDDNDRVSDLHERIANTDPLDPASFLWLRIARGPNDLARMLKFPASTGRTYRIQGRVNYLVDAWVDMRTNIPGVNGIMSLPHTNLGERIFYRIGVESP